jgi:transglutaminase-like putative cysteine protease
VPGPAVVDGAAAALLATIATTGFKTSFGGWAFAVPAICAALAGAAVAVVCHRRALPGYVTLAIAIAVFVAIGGPLCVREYTLVGLPTPAAARELLDGATTGWARLLTVIPPAGEEGNLLAVPFVAAFVAALASASLAIRRRWVGAPVAPPGIALVIAILWGTAQPASLLLQSCGFALSACLWLSIRSSRGRQVISGGRGFLRPALGVCMVSIAAVSAVVVGGGIPFASAQRYVLRDHTEPPFDPSVFPSPLARYPAYVDADGDRNKQPLVSIKTAEPLPNGSILRLAAMDAYDGGVYSVTADRSATGRFVKTSSVLPNPVSGPRISVDVTVAGLRDVWLPVLGQPVSLVATGKQDRRVAMTEDMRFNFNTRALVLPSVTRAGDSYRLTTVLDAAKDRAVAKVAPPDEASLGASLPDSMPESYRAIARRIVETANAKTALEKAEAIEKALHDDGVVKVDAPSLHSVLRLDRMIDQYKKRPDGPLAGTAEQYSALMAILARTLDLPARVVVGFQIPDGVREATLTGESVRAWVEIAFEGVGWLRFDPLPEQTEKKEQPQKPPQSSENIPPEPPPPAVPPQPPVVPAQNAKAKQRGGSGFDLSLTRAQKIALYLLSLPLGAAGSCFGVAAAKTRRRKRRRSGNAADQVAGAWAELLDVARDHGVLVPSHLTRNEAGQLLGTDVAASIAARADAHRFSGVDVTDAAAADMWDEVLEAAKAFEEDLSSFQRFQARANPQSFLPSHVPNVREAMQAATRGVLPMVPGRVRPYLARSEPR